MRSLSRTFLLLGLAALTAALLPGGLARGQEKKKDADTKDVSFKTFDGAELKGTLYPNASGKRDAVVLLLHDFDSKKGGSSQKDKLPELAKALQEDGYVVLSFDFRGFGESKNVDKSKFWKYPHNRYIKGAVRMPESIEYNNFMRGYYPYLVNDIAAAKAYLDRLNDQKICNSSSLIVIGAGQAAALGSLWMFNETKRRKDKNSGSGGLMPIVLDDPESKDLACGFWLTISPTIEGRSARLQSWLYDVGQRNKVPMGFMLGKNDTRNDNLVSGVVKSIRNGKTKVKVGVARIAGTNLVGARLLEKNLGTEKLIRKFLAEVMEARGQKEWRERDIDKKAYYYTNPMGKILKLNKPSGAEAPAVDLQQLGY